MHESFLGRCPSFLGAYGIFHEKRQSFIRPCPDFLSEKPDLRSEQEVPQSPFVNAEVDRALEKCGRTKDQNKRKQKKKNQKADKERKTASLWPTEPETVQNPKTTARGRSEPAQKPGAKRRPQKRRGKFELAEAKNTFEERKRHSQQKKKTRPQ